MTKYKLGTIAGFSLSARPPAIYGSITLFVVLLGIAIGNLRLTVGEAIVGSLVAVIFALLLRNSDCNQIESLPGKEQK